MLRNLSSFLPSKPRYQVPDQSELTSSRRSCCQCQVVRQAIIPLSLHMKRRRFDVVIHESAACKKAFDALRSASTTSAPALEICVARKGLVGERAVSYAAIWDEAILVEELCLDDGLLFRVSGEKELSLTVAATDFWQGFKGSFQLDGLELHVLALASLFHAAFRLA